jgi:hypothetical protein
MQYIIALFPKDQYDTIKAEIENIKATPSYEQIIDENAPIYLKDNIEYMCGCIAARRIPFDTVAPEGLIYDITENPSKWLTDNGFERPVVEEMI